MADNEKPARFMQPATKGELGLVAGNAVIALRSIQLALLNLQKDDTALFSTHLDEIEKHADNLWARFQDLTRE